MYLYVCFLYEVTVVFTPGCVSTSSVVDVVHIFGMYEQRSSLM